jgi:preprotein translocase subunit SecD
MKSVSIMICFIFFMPMCIALGADAPGRDCSIIRFVEVGEGDEPDVKAYKMKGSDVRLPVTGPDIVNACSVESAEVRFNKNDGQWRIEIKFTAEGTKAFRTATERLMGKKIAVIYRDEILIAPVVRDVIASGAVVITGGTSEKEALEIAAVLNGK